MEMLISGPLKMVGYACIFFALAGVFVTGEIFLSLVLGLFGAALIWGGRWVTAWRHARVDRKYDKRAERSQRINDEFF